MRPNNFKRALEGPLFLNMQQQQNYKERHSVLENRLTRNVKE